MSKKNNMLTSEDIRENIAADELLVASQDDENGYVIEGFYPANIIRLKDGILIAEGGMQSTDEGRIWRKSRTFKSLEYKGLVRLPNGELGAVVGKWGMTEALGNASNNWYFRWSSDEGQSWSDPVQITLPGLTMGLPGTGFTLTSERVMVITYSQFLGSRFDKRGASWGSYKGVRFQTETEGHFPDIEACRAYYSDDNGRTWTPCDGWIIGWRDERLSDAFCEGVAVELKDGRILMAGRTVVGRLYAAFSSDCGHSWWPGAQPMELMSSFSPSRICRLPGSGDLLIVWNQCSREEIRKGLRRGRLSCAVSKDEGKTWDNFKNIEAISSMKHVTRVPPDPDFNPVMGDKEVGELPEDFAIFHYPNISVVGEEVFISYDTATFALGKDTDGKPVVKSTPAPRTRILPVEWFYN